MENSIVNRDQFQQWSENFKKLNSEGTKRAARRLGKSTPIQNEEKYQHIGKASAYINGVLEGLKSGYYEGADLKPDDPLFMEELEKRRRKMAMDINMANLVGLATMVDSNKLLIDCLSVTEACIIRPVSGGCEACNKFQRGERSMATGGYICVECGGPLKDVKIESKNKGKRGYRRYTLSDMFVELESVLSGAEPDKKGEGGEPGVVPMTYNLMMMINDMARAITNDYATTNPANLPDPHRYIDETIKTSEQPEDEPFVPVEEDENEEDLPSVAEGDAVEDKNDDE